MKRSSSAAKRWIWNRTWPRGTTSWE